MPQGVVERVMSDRGFGFIRPDGAPRGGNANVFFHISGMASSRDFEVIRIGDRVSYELHESPRGARAEGVVRLDD